MKERCPAHEDIMDGRVQRVGVGAGRVRETRLGIEINHEHSLAKILQSLSEGVNRGRLGDAALLIRYSNYSCHQAIVGQ